ncbi:MAG: PD-(D/E)XK nuclease family protein [Spirochaetaceae bacterium]|nr:PD-(D/E)XK nuclease family protein [Spirochaetaceae bacterium]
MNKTRIFNEFEKGNICVFNDSLCERDFLIQYAALNNSIEESRAISYKTFKNYFVEDRSNKESATSITRLLFVIDFLSEKNLSYFINNKYPESLDISSQYVSTLLPSLKRVKENEAFSLLPENMISDINKLYDSYCAFLGNRCLYEESYSEYKFKNASEAIRSNNYSIIAYDTMPDLLPFLEDLGNPSNINLIESSQEEPSVQIEKFENCSAEVATQMRRIRYLLEKGINPSDIAITLASFDIQIDDIKREAKKYNIPLTSAPSSKIINYPMGKLFYNLRVIFEQRFSLNFMKSFLLDRSFPFKERSLIRGLIRVGIDANISHGQIEPNKDSDTWELSLIPSKKTREKDIELYSKYTIFYTTFKRLVINLNVAKTKDDIELSILNIINFLFDVKLDEEDSTKECFNRVLEEFKSVFDSMEYCGINSIDNLYGKLISQIENIKYEEKIGNNEGIIVYSYPSSSSLNIPNHFILGVNHTASEVINTPLFILPPSIDEKYREEQDLSSSILNDYLTSEYQPYVSFSGEDYIGSQLPPSFFIEHNLVSEEPLEVEQANNAYRDEELYFALKKDSFKALPLQSLGFYSANNNILTSLLHDMANRKLEGEVKNRILSFLKNDDGEYELSSTSIDSFERCPYQWALKYIMKIREDSFDNIPLDHLEVGNFLHKVMELFFLKVQKEDKRFFSSFLEKYEYNLEKIFYQELNNYRESDKSPSAYSLIYIEDNFKPKVMGILEQEIKMFDSYSYNSFEKDFNLHNKVLYYNDDGSISKEIKYHLRGKVDKIVELPEAGYAIVDYKKGSATINNKSFIKGSEDHDLKSYQFPCYRQLMKGENMEALMAAYYGFNDGKYEVVWENDGSVDLELVDELFQMVLEDMLAKIEEGDFIATPSKDHCGMCNYRQVCRKRYSTK